MRYQRWKYIFLLQSIENEKIKRYLVNLDCVIYNQTKIFKATVITNPWMYILKCVLHENRYYWNSVYGKALQAFSNLIPHIEKRVNAKIVTSVPDKLFRTITIEYCYVLVMLLRAWKKKQACYWKNIFRIRYVV